MDAQKKLELFKRILSLGSIWGQMDEVDFLDQIWNLHLLNSDDPRYKDAYGDADQHLRKNSDWDEEYTFLTRFGLLKSTDDTYYKFLNMVVAPEVRGSEEEILRYVREINSVLVGTDCALERIATRANLPVYNFVQNIQGKLWPEDIEKNRIPIFFNSTVDEFPAFVLRSINWDDFGNKTSFELYYYNENRQMFPVGSVKIMYDYKDKTADVLPEKCLLLSDHFCSVGQDLSYYSAIKDLFPQKYKSVLFALRDAAYFSSIADIYQQTIAFQKSLLRNKSAFEAYRNAVCVLEGIDISQRYNFSVKCEIPYCALSRANTTEHILPKDDYPEYAIDALNLLPCCSDCNSAKGSKVRDGNGNPLIINFYYNKLPETQYLYVRLLEDEKGYIDFEYYLDNPNHQVEEPMFQLIKSHFEKLGLIEKYEEEAIANYVEIENSLKSSASESEVKKYLNDLRSNTLEDAKEYGSNHWKVILKLALADSEWYTKYLE